MSAVVRTLVLASVLGMALCRPTNEPSRVARAAARVITSCTVPNTAAITFDDGPYRWNRQVVNTLDAAGIKGTFFVNGNNYDCIFNGNNPDNVLYAYSQGHQIASHTWAHLHLATLAPADIRSEFSRTNDAIKKITGATPAFMRPPYGEYNQDVLDVAGALGQSVVLWDFDSGDSAGKSANASAEAYQDWVNGRPKSVLTLNHETYSSTVNDLLPQVIKIFREAGYRMATVSECLGMDPYLNTGAPSGRDASWTC